MLSSAQSSAHRRPIGAISYPVLPPFQRQHFDPENPKYKCFCQAFHLKQGAIAIGLVEIIFSFLIMGLSYVLNAGFFDAKISDYADFSLDATLGALDLITITLVFVAVCNNQKYLLIPRLLCQMLNVILITVSVTFASVAIFHMTNPPPSPGPGPGPGPGPHTHSGPGSHPHPDDRDHPNPIEIQNFVLSFFIFHLVVHAVFGLLEIWFFVQLFKLFQFYGDEKEFGPTRSKIYPRNNGKPSAGKIVSKIGMDEQQTTTGNGNGIEMQST